MSYDMQQVAPVNILLVEDNPADVRLTREALSDARIRLSLADVEDGVEALDYLFRRGSYWNAARPDLVLLDLNLPRKDGCEVLAEIKNHPDLKSIPVVILTTSQAEQDVVRSYNLHANAYVTKPVDFAQFVEVVRSIEGFWLTVVKLPPGDPRARA